MTPDQYRRYADRIAKLDAITRHRNLDGKGERGLQQHVEELVALENSFNRCAPQPAPDAMARLVGAEMPHAWLDVIDERVRQITSEGWTTEHDDALDGAAMAHSAACYTICAAQEDGHEAPPPLAWPWDFSWWKPTDPRRDLVKAGALILAEIERLDRAALAAMETDDDRT